MSSITDQAKTVVGDVQAQAKKASDGSSAVPAQGSSLYDQATSLAGNAFQYAKETTGIAQKKADETARDAQATADDVANKQTGQTLGGLVGQAKQLASDTLGTAKSYVEAGQQKANEQATLAQGHAVDAKERGESASSSYVDQARNLAAGALGTAQSYLQAADKKAGTETSQHTGTSDPLTTQASNLVSDTKASADGALGSAVKQSGIARADADRKREGLGDKVGEAQVNLNAAGKTAGNELNKALGNQ